MKRKKAKTNMKKQKTKNLDWMIKLKKKLTKEPRIKIINQKNEDWYKNILN